MRLDTLKHKVSLAVLRQNLFSKKIRHIQAWVFGKYCLVVAFNNPDGYGKAQKSIKHEDAR